jgi:hypothetical protein
MAKAEVIEAVVAELGYGDDAARGMTQPECPIERAPFFAALTNARFWPSKMPLANSSQRGLNCRAYESSQRHELS